MATPIQKTQRACSAFVVTGTFLVTFLFRLHPACSAESPTPLTTLTAVKILSGDEFILSDNRTIRLEGIKAPFPESEALTAQSRAMLEKLTAGKPLTLDHVSTDRYGRLAAQVFISQSNGASMRLQEAMLREGLAFIYPPTGQEPNLDALFTAENDARAAKRGIWADEMYADTPDTKAWRAIGHFAFISDTILKAERIKDKVYLNFGADWHKDFTITIAAHDLTAFHKAGIDPLSYEGKTIRVRGWVDRNSGPMMTVTTPAQIQITGNP